MTESDPQATPADETPAADDVAAPAEPAATEPAATEPAPAETAPGEVAPAAEAADDAAADDAAAADEAAADEAPEAPAEEAPAEEAAPEPAPAPRTDYTARNPLWTVGRRKSSSARVRMFPGGGNFMVNGKPLDEYFCHLADRDLITGPLDLIDERKTYDVWVNVHGGGTSGQAGAIAMGVARGLGQLHPEHDRLLRDANMMRRDARVKERKKYGRRGARRGFQFSKR